MRTEFGNLLSFEQSCEDAEVGKVVISVPGERAQAINEKIRKEHAKLVPRKAHSFGQVLTLFRSRGSRFSEFSLEQSEPKRSRCRGVLHSCSLPVVDLRGA